MSTLTSILQTSSQGLAAAQTGINTVSNNVANLNTAGYVREIVNQGAISDQGLGAGVVVSGVTRAANQYLQNASLSASGTAGLSSAISSTLSQAQALFGDPTSTTSYFNQLNTVFADFSAAANTPTSSLSSQQAISDVSQFLSKSQSIDGSLSALSTQADASATNDVSQINQLLGQISQLNTDITSVTASNGQAADLQNSQSQLINQLSSLIGVKVASTASGGVSVSTAGGAQLVGQFGAATLSYTSTANATGQVSITQPAAQQAQSLAVTSGDLGGVLSLRNTQIPGLRSQLSEFVTQTVNAINQASNAASSVPPPAQLNGSNTGLDLPTAIGGFTGSTTIAIVNGSGVLQHSYAVTFNGASGGTISVDGGAATAFTTNNFLTSLNTALGTNGTASFTNGALSLSTSVAGTGLAIQDSSATPTNNAGRGFSQYFGLNNLISSSAITNYNTGLTATDASGFTPGGTITLGVGDAYGNPITDVTVTMPAAGTVQGVINALNSSATGVGLFGQFSLSSTGALTFTPTGQTGATLTVLSDTTQRGAGGPSLSQLFGIGDAQQASRTATYSVRSDIVANPSKLPLATLDLGAATTGQPVLVAGDGSGGQLLAAAGSTTQSFAAAGTAAAIATSVTQYSAQFAGSLADTASAAAQASTNATSVQTEAETQRQSVEGVNLDQELVNLTTYQQAYSASARLVTATQDLFTALINMLG
jgi:flagellar hook-associated protein 1 FlgK